MNWPARRRTGRARPIAVVAVLTLAATWLAACDRGGAAATGMSLTIAQPSHGLHILPLDVAVQQGFFKKEGLDVKVREVNGDATAIPAVVSGSVQVAQDTSTPILVANAKRSHLQVLAAMSGPPLQIVMNKSVADRLHITANTPIARKVAALKGLKVAVNDIGGGLQYVLNSVLSQYGVAPKSVDVAAITPYTSELSALKAGRVDVIGPVSPYGSAAIDGGYGVPIADVFAGQVPGISTVQYSVIDASASWIQKNPKAARAVRAAIGDALNYIRTNPDGAAKVAKVNLPTLTESELVSAIKNGAYPSDVDISASEYKQTAALAGGTNAAAGRVPYDTAVWSGAQKS